MKIKLYQSHAAGSNPAFFIDRNPNMSYLLIPDREDSAGVLIDASADPDQVARDLDAQRIKLGYVLLTHFHADHTSGLAGLAGRFPEARIGAHPSSLSALSSRGFTNLLPLENGTVISLGDEELTALHTPGHTWDSFSFLVKDGCLFFSGDTVFGGGIGCVDYLSGGNRNTFYWTIQDLLELLPPETLIYPGHYSEHHRMPPPYALSGEKEKNPYIINALQGKRGDFDRDLRAFSAEFEPRDGILLSEADLDEIVGLEKAIWIPELQAPREKFRERLQHGHRLIAVRRHNTLAGMIGWRYSDFSLETPADQFPATFAGFSACESEGKADYRSAFIYSVGVRPDHRENGIGSLLLQHTTDQIRKDGISRIFVDSRLPSYYGSSQSDQENIPQDLSFKESIDRYFKDGRFPTDGEFAADPRIRFYMRNGFKPWRIVRDFIQDEASGNMRVVCYMNLEKDDMPRR